MNQFKVELAMELLGCKINFYRPGEFYGSYLRAIIPRPYEENIKPDGIPEGIGIYVKNLLRGGEAEGGYILVPGEALHYEKHQLKTCILFIR